MLTKFDTVRLQQQLLAWFRKSRRDLPWRRTRDPYRVWVAEVMLQQTQVATVLPYYRRFLARFPTVETLAGASDQAVLKVWQGLGYYRRAMNLRAAARAVVRDHGGRIPDDPAAFAALPGVGRYTCGAVLSIAFGRRLAALDGNAVRVIARWLALTQTVDRPATRAKLWSAAEAFVPERGAVPFSRRCEKGAVPLSGAAASKKGTAPFSEKPEKGAVPFFSNPPGDWNQAVMELGATVCLPRGPHCGQCPVRRHCRAAAKGIQDRIPARRRRKPIPHIEVGAGIIWRRGRVLLCKRRADAMLGGLWEFPGGKRRPGESVQRCIRRELMEECALPVTVGKHLIDVTHTYTHLRVTLRVYHCRAGPGRIKLLGCDDARWVRPQDIARYPLPAADVKILEALFSPP
ncbi:MAG: A/G-specific adenine glycosylase [Planctomycetota bacterium]|nr:A/G-specific adenine glycosylase [Planctomycetota bacterium]